MLAQPLFDSPWVLWCAAAPSAGRSCRGCAGATCAATPLVAAGRDHERSVAQMRLTRPRTHACTPVDVVDNISTALGIAAQGLAATLAPAYVGVVAEASGW